MIRVASYCRVSTDKEDQINSFEAQQRYFTEYIKHHPDWELYDVYADEGITGTSTKKRIQFNRMMNDAFAGKFQLIITKEVSRFSRNILDTIAYTRELKKHGVTVQFVMDGINTVNPDAELYLSIMASMAQEESRKTSGRVTWGQTRQMEKGIVFGHSLLGYDVKDGQIYVEPDGAETVRLIFRKYAIEQLGTSQIAKYLTQNGYRTKSGTSVWNPNSVLKILRNEKYVGDLVQKKTYTPDFLTHEKKRNRGEVPLIRIDNHHEPIIDRQLWNLAQFRLRQRNKRSKDSFGCSTHHVFSGKIKCGECGSSFVCRYKYAKTAARIRRWSCAKTVHSGVKGCAVGTLLRDDEAYELLKSAINSLLLNRNEIIDKIATLITEESKTGESDPLDMKRLQRESQMLSTKKEAVLDSYFSGDISKEEMQTMLQRYKIQAEHITDQMKSIIDYTQHTRRELCKIAASILQFDMVSQAFCKEILEEITVFGDRHVELRLKGLGHVFKFFR